MVPTPLGVLRGPAILIIATTITACGQTADPSAGATAPPTARATPSPSPQIDVAAVFVETVSSSDFTVTAELTGTMSVGAGDGAISGSLTSGGSAFHQVVEVALSGSSQVSEVIFVDGTTYELEGGMWFESRAPGSAQQALPDDLSSLRDVGEVERDGDRLRRLVPTEPLDVDAASLGFGGPAVSDFAADFEFFATEAGVPAAMTLEARWTQDVNGEPIAATMSLDYVFTRIGQPIDIVPPAAAWARFTSEALGYRIAHPSTWDFQHIPSDGDYPASDGFHAPVTTETLTPGVQVFRYADLEQSFAPNLWFEGSRQVLEEVWGTPVEASEHLSIGGLDAQLFALHGAFEDGEPAYVQQAAIIRGDVAWELDWYSAPGDETRDRELFLQMLATFAPTD